MKKPRRPNTLATRRDVREILGISKQGVHKIEDQLPAPIDVREDGKIPIWRRADIERYAEDRRSPAVAGSDAHPEPGP